MHRGDNKKKNNMVMMVVMVGDDDNTAYPYKKNAEPYIADNDVWPAPDYKIFHFSYV